MDRSRASHSGSGCHARDPIAAGFALPWVLFTLILVSLLATSGFLLTWLEGQAAHAFARSTDAFYVAEAGLATASAGAVGPGPVMAPLTIGGGQATVRFVQLLDLAPGEKVFRVESVGSVISGGTTYRRTVAQLLWVASPPRVPGALTILGGLSGIAPTGSISGYDAGVGGCPGQPAPVAGIAHWGAPPGAFSGLPVTGSPATRPMAPTTSVALATGVRWAELIAPFGPTPDATVPPDAWPGSGVGSGWPYIRLPGSATLGSGRSGRGAIVADADLTLGPGFSWSGLVLIGGTLRLSGDVRIRGAVVSGLGGQSAIAAELGSHRLDLELDACAVSRASRRLTAPAAIVPGTWYEDW